MSRHALPITTRSASDAWEAMMVNPTSDDHDLSRFVEAQEGVYEQAVAEIKRGNKRSHWMWFIFPQFDGLASSSMSKRYAIKSLAEAKAYLGHPLLGPRLLACAEAMLSVQGRSATDILGYPDDLKLRSCATLFAAVAPRGSVFERILDSYYRGEPDQRTQQLLGESHRHMSDEQDDGTH